MQSHTLFTISHTNTNDFVFQRFFFCYLINFWDTRKQLSPVFAYQEVRMCLQNIYGNRERAKKLPIRKLRLLHWVKHLIQDCFKQIHVFFEGGVPIEFFCVLWSTLSECFPIFWILADLLDWLCDVTNFHWIKKMSGLSTNFRQTGPVRTKCWTAAGHGFNDW